MAETVQKNFRMSQQAIKLLHSVARARGMTETDVVEYCVSKFALDLGQDVDRAKELLFRQICAAAAKSPIPHSRTGESLALNEEARGARETGGAADVQPSQSPAGALTEMAGDKWGEGKKEKGKKK